MELSSEAYAVIGMLVVTNAGAAIKITIDWLNKRKAESDDERQKAVAEAVAQARLETRLDNLFMVVGKLEGTIEKVRGDLNAAWGKLKNKTEIE